MISLHKKLEAEPTRRQSGVGLIEVLIALVVVSIGVLGMASLQLTGMKHSSGSFNRAKALLYAQSMATRIRLNPVSVSGHGTDDYDYANFDSTGFSCAVPPVPYCQAREGQITPSCTPKQLAAVDLFSVACGELGPGGAEKGVIGTLPNGTLTVDCVGGACNGSSSYNVTVSWTEGRSRTETDELITRRVQVRLKP